MNYYIAVLKKYATFSGRARRKEYWLFTLFNIIIFLALAIVDSIFGSYDAESGVGALSGLYNLLVFLPSLAVFVRRLHDTGRTGWWFFIAFIPVIGVIVLLIFMVLEGDAGSNDYGPSPLEMEEGGTDQAINM